MRIVAIIGMVFLLCASLSFSQPVSTPKLAVGAFAGLSMPLVQDDQANGSTFGFMARFKVLPLITLEPNITLSKWGKPNPIDGVQLGDGSKVTSFGVDAVLGNLSGVAGMKPYFVVGVASYKIKNDATGYDESNLGLSAGLGIGFGVLPKIDLDLRGKFIVAPQDQGSKKAISITGGIAYNLGGI